MKKILVIGELILDRFVYLDCNRLSPEACVPVGIPIKIEENAGCAGNVVANLQSLGQDLQIYLLRQPNIIIKTRFLDSKYNHNFVRVDENDIISNSLTESDLQKFLTENNLSFKDLDAILFVDYNKGFLTQDFIQKISEICKLCGVLTFIDTKKILGYWSKNITFVKINDKEYNYNFDITKDKIIDFCENLIVTLGKNGSKYINKEKKEENISTNEVKISNVAGAGDSYLAAFVIKYLETKNIIDSMKFANRVATFAVTQPGVIAVKLLDLNNN